MNLKSKDALLLPTTMLQLLNSLIYFSLLVFSSTAEQNKLNLHFLRPGETLTIPIFPASKIHIKNKQVVLAQDLGRSILLTAKKQGSSLVRINSRSTTIVVSNEQNRNSFEKLKSIVQIIPGLTVDWQDDHFELNGHIHELAEWKALADLKIKNLKMKASTPISAKQAILSEINLKVAAKGLPLAKLEEDNVVLLPPHSKTVLQFYQDLFLPYGFQLKISDDLIDFAPMIKVKLTIVEARKSFSRKLGIHFPTSVNAMGNFFPELFLKALEEEGQGRILASPTLLCRSGKEADFFAGGEFPIKLIRYKGQDITWKKYGVTLKFKPQADFNGRMRIELSAEILSLDLGKAVDDIPAMFSNRISTHFDLNRSQSIVLSGLIKKIDGETLSGLPGLRRLPILGPLFESQDFQEDRTEMLIIVQPEIITENTSEIESAASLTLTPVHNFVSNTDRSQAKNTGD